MAAQRPALSGELCSCGRPAVVMFLTDDFGPVGWCGLHTSDAESGPLGQSEVESALPLPRVTLQSSTPSKSLRSSSSSLTGCVPSPTMRAPFSSSPDLYGAEDLAADLERLVNLIETAPIGP